MIATTIAYLAAVSLAASVGALLADAGLRRLRLPTRWAWLGAMLLGPTLLGGAVLLRVAAWNPAPIVAVPVMLSLDALVATGASPDASSWRTLLERVAGIVWGFATAALLLFLARAHLRLRRERATWQARRVRAATVYISDRRGPAVSGLLRSWMVLPAWVLGLPREEVRLVMRHEGEHLRAGDSRLVLSGLILAVLTPWNLLGWWQLRRLRTAVEIDCDRRVLAHAADVRAYGAALLSVAAGVEPERDLAFAAFSENAHTLKTRILAMTAIRSRWTRPAGALLVLSSVAVTVQACGVESPSMPTAPVIGERGAQLSREITETPSFTPFTKAPNLTNREEVGAALEAFYAQWLRGQGLRGKTQVWVRISDQGVVERVEVHKTSDVEVIDQGAVAVARVMRFTPAMNNEQAVPVWVSIPITFQDRLETREGATTSPRPPVEQRSLQGREMETAPQSPGRPEVDDTRTVQQIADREAEAPPPSGSISETPTFTPFDAAPNLTNRQEVGQALEAAYPAALREAGVSGKAEIWVRIGVSGEVERVAIQNSSGEESLDEAALAVGRVMRFRPAMNRGRAVPVWVAIPITFQIR